MEALLAFALAVLLAFPSPAAPPEKMTEQVPAPVQTEAASPEPTAEPTPEPTPEPEIRRIEEVVEGTVQRVFDGYIHFVYKKVQIQVNIGEHTEMKQTFTTGTNIRIAHSGEILMTEPMQITADRIEVIEQ